VSGISPKRTSAFQRVENLDTRVDLRMIELLKQWVALMPAMSMPSMPSMPSLPTNMGSLLQNKMLLIGVGVAVLVILATAFWFLRGDSKTVFAPVDTVKERKYDLYMDVRTNEEVEATGDYPGSLHIPLDSIEKAKGIPKETHILVYCNSGKRAKQAAAKLVSMGFTRVEYTDVPYTAFLQESFVEEQEEQAEQTVVENAVPVDNSEASKIEHV
jgi:phage shock protein E